jgi:hypothetical protein
LNIDGAGEVAGEGNVENVDGVFVSLELKLKADGVAGGVLNVIGGAAVGAGVKIDGGAGVEGIGLKVSAGVDGVGLKVSAGVVGVGLKVSVGAVGIEAGADTGTSRDVSFSTMGARVGGIFPTYVGKDSTVAHADTCRKRLIKTES